MGKLSTRPGGPVKKTAKLRVYGVATMVLGGLAVAASMFLPSQTGGADPSWAPWGKTVADAQVPDTQTSGPGVLDLVALLPGDDASTPRLSALPGADPRSSATKKRSSRGDHSTTQPLPDDPEGSLIDDVTSPISGPTIPPVNPTIPPVNPTIPPVNPTPSPSPTPTPSPPGEDDEEAPLVPVTPPDAEPMVAQVAEAIEEVLFQIGQLYTAVTQALNDMTAGLIPATPTIEEIQALVDETAPSTPSQEEIQALVVGSVPEEVTQLIGSIQSAITIAVELAMDFLFGDASQPYVEEILKVKSDYADPAVQTAIATSGEAYATATASADAAIKQVLGESETAVNTVTQTVGTAIGSVDQTRRWVEETAGATVGEALDSVGQIQDVLNDPPPTIESVLTLAVNASDPVGTPVSVVEGHTYRFVIKGTYKYAMGSSLDMEADATCARELIVASGEITGFRQDAYTVDALETAYENALEVSVSSLPLGNAHGDWKPVSDDDGTGCSASHVYELDYLGGNPVGAAQAGLLHFRVIDWNNAYTDNAGAFVLEVHETIPVPRPTNSNLGAGLLGWLMIALLVPAALHRKGRPGETWS